MHEDRERVDGRVVEPADPCRHHARTAVGDGLDDRSFVRAVEPDLVRQIRRAELFVALATVAMASRAVVGEDLLAYCEIGAHAYRKAGQRSYVVGHHNDLLLLEHVALAE